MAVVRTCLDLVAVCSRDGFIVPPDGASPWVWASVEEQAQFGQAVRGFDWAIMGRMTHELAWRPAARRVIFTRRFAGPLWLHPRRLWADPRRVPFGRILEALAAIRTPARCGILGGVAVHDWFADRGLIDSARISIEPLTFGGGVPLFSDAAGVAPEVSLGRRGLRLAETRELNPAGSRLCRFVRA